MQSFFDRKSNWHLELIALALYPPYESLVAMIGINPLLIINASVKVAGYADAPSRDIYFTFVKRASVFWIALPLAKEVRLPAGRGRRCESNIVQCRHHRWPPAYLVPGTMAGTSMPWPTTVQVRVLVVEATAGVTCRVIQRNPLTTGGALIWTS